MRERERWNGNVSGLSNVACSMVLKMVEGSPATTGKAHWEGKGKGNPKSSTKTQVYRGEMGRATELPHAEKFY